MPLDTKSASVKEWSDLQSKHFNFYQDQIDRITYGLQRAQRGNLFTGNFFYPAQYQKDILDLELMFRKQQLGEIKQSEVDEFKQFNPSITSDLNMTFNKHRPFVGLGMGVLAFGVLQKFNVSYSFRISSMLISITADVLWNQYSSAKRGVKFNSIEFMDWAIQCRKAKAQLEMNKSQLQQKLVEEYSKQLGNTNVVKAIEQLASL